jgi:DeoR/GlpR family transcriptional regulator of sugar metabolism
MEGIRKIYPAQPITLNERQQALFDKIKRDGTITIDKAIQFSNGTYKTVRNDLAALTMRELISSSRVGSRNIFTPV